ncbi:dynamin family protein [Sediminibacillus albus]|uniref:Dynamin family protein n=1 Tax=Sediminibacillus albus TaxID=407036 RepID=A0A1G8VUR7_9BACI|nr:dynamin family protein [Sediminibacillus albus]SDJ69861.1 Dynamin family protein [Sediminibacillus albus]
MKTLLQTNTAGYLSALYTKFKQNNDEESAEKVLDLLEKFKNKEFTISFSGSFSAGKSSMINTLIGEEILPQSPIPTSANVVKIYSGEGQARIYYRQGGQVQYDEPYDMEMIKSYCKDGDEIIKVEIAKKLTVIPEGVSLMDTPGIDSANDADKVITESSLHLVDVLFYVMDYNHVQSEVNLSFLKEMQSIGKEIYIIINQVDKHREQELSFEQYTNRVKNTFSDWGIKPVKTFYTSLKKNQLPINQLEQVKTLFTELMAVRDQAIVDTIAKSSATLIDQHIQWLKEQMEDEKAAIYQKLNKLDDGAEGPNQLEERKQQVKELKALASTVKSEIRETVESTLKNAYLMPYELRTLAEAFLESRQEKFKAGFFSTKGKITRIREERLDLFYHQLLKTMESSIEWKLRDKISGVLKNYQIKDPVLLEQVHELSVDFSKDKLTGLIKPGATLTGEYLLRYTEDLSNHIKQLYKQESLSLLTTIERFVGDIAAQKTEKLQRLINNSEEYDQLEGRLTALDDQIIIEKKELQQLAFYSGPVDNSMAVIRDALNKRQSSIVFRKPETPEPAEKSALPSALEEEQLQKPEKPVNASHTIEKTVEMITTTLTATKHLPGFKVIREDLIQKKHRLENNQYTIALFGAFSAGKSSFANALLGENVLPVSPNPTTAAINKICPPTSELIHGTVIVQMKQEYSLIKEIADITNGFEGEEIETLGSAIDWLANRYLQEKQQMSQKHLSFLAAVAEGYEHLSSKLGNQLTITMNEFPDYVAEESLACFVDWMELYYDCPLTRQGISLVDTPGADSINSRHTNVSFEYIKQADAILFVTYYNHPFSKADKDFLVQLGRVKDAFSLDKMFFIINAADLAKDSDELRLVTNYISEQLLGFGIRNPRLFPVSSLQALIEKQNNRKTNSGMDRFEDAFYQFIHEELAGLLVGSAISDMKRASQLLNNYISAATMSNHEKEQLKEKYKDEQVKLEKTIQVSTPEIYTKQISQKLSKQVYFVQQRMSIQFTDFFKAAFNPATITGSGKDARPYLQNALNKLIKEIGFELAQELKAVSLRMEQFINSKAKEWNQQMFERCRNVREELDIGNVEVRSFASPNIVSAFAALDMSVFHPALNLYKNPKAFFEKNEKEEMKNRLLEILTPLISEYLTENHTMLHDFYKQEWEEQVRKMQTHQLSAISQYYEGIQHTLSEQTDVHRLENARDTITSILPS